jgi:putative MATE family efflux protein
MMMSRPAHKFDRSIIEGPITRAVWRLAWPTVLQNIIGGLQGIIDHAMVGHFVGYTGNAAIGVAFQIFLVVMVFISSLFTGRAVLVARFAGAGDSDQVNRTVAQAFMTAVAMALGILAPIGYVLSPWLLGLVNAAPEVQAEALPYLRVMFVFSLGMMLFFMLGGALRSAGDARTPLRLGVAMTAMNIVFNIILIRGLGPIPAFGTAGAAMGTAVAGGLVSLFAMFRLFSGKWVVAFPRQLAGWKPDWKIIRALFRFGLPSGMQGVAMNVGGVLLLRFIGSLEQSAEAQAAYAVGYTELFSLVTWTSVGLMGATAAVAGQNLGAGRPDRTIRGVQVASWFGLGVQLLAFLSLSGFFISVALAYTGGLQGTGDTKSPFYISLVSQIAVPLGLCAALQAGGRLEPAGIWLAILLGHATRCWLSVARFRQGKWRHIDVGIAPARP